MDGIRHTSLAALRIAVLSGGQSAERKISLQSGAAVADALQRKGHSVTRIDPAEQSLETVDWSTLDALMPEGFAHGPKRRTGLASTLSAGLEMARDGLVELRQMAPFAPVYLRARKAPPSTTDQEIQ